MAGAGFKNFTTGDVLTASDVQGYLMDQSVMVFAGTAARASAIPSPSEGMVTYRTDDDAVEVFDGSAWNSIGGVGAAVISSPAATGSYSSGGTTYNYYTFTASGTLTVDAAGFADVLVVGGGGAGGSTGGSGATRGGSGGGAGGVLAQTLYMPDGSHTVTIGGGGTWQAIQIKPGNDSYIGTVCTAVGGGGGAQLYDEWLNGGKGGSGGGGASAGPSVFGQGNVGGTYNGAAGGGGGGAGAAGANAPSTTVGGAGGNGVASSITGTSVTYGGGGGGRGSSTPGAGGSGGGGAGVVSGTGNSGTINTGGGGGGTYNGGTGGSGGSGIVIIRVAV